MGFVRSDRIACLYHGWQYGTDGRCLHIPAHPDIQVPPTIITWRHSCREAIGMIWVHFGEAANRTRVAGRGGRRDVVPVRSLYIDRPAERSLSISSQLNRHPFRAKPKARGRLLLPPRRAARHAYTARQR